jgi:hypothetical protein
MCVKSCPDRPPMAAISVADSSQKSHRLPPGQKPDGRSSGARRYRAIVAAFTAEIGGDLTAAEQGLINQAATLTLRAEQLAADVINGAPVDDDQLIRISGTAKRLLGAISAKAADKKPATQTLAEYWASKNQAAELEADDVHKDE